MRDIEVDDSQFNLLVIPSLELLGPKLVCVDPCQVVYEDLIGKLDKLRSKLDTTLSLLDSFVISVEDILAALGPGE